MLRNLDELSAYLGEVAKAYPELRREMEFGPNGVPAAEIARIRSILPIPPIYSHCLEERGMSGVSIGFFNLWPSFQRRDELTRALVDKNAAQGELVGMARANSLLLVATEEANWIGVGMEGCPTEDRVYYIDTMSGPEIRVLEIAPNFIVFLLLAGNLQHIARRAGKGLSGASREMEQVCEVQKCKPEHTKFWLQKTEELTD